MDKIYIVGNPNSGKTTLFNSITKSNERVGNWHGVTVDKTSKRIKMGDAEYEIVDLPGIYSLNSFSLEEQVSIDEIASSKDNKILYLMDANNFKRSMLLALDLLTNNKNLKILINNYKGFNKNGGIIDIDYLKKVLGCDIEIVDARHLKPNNEFFDFKTKETAFIKSLKNEIKTEKDTNINQLKYKKIEILYKYIFKMAKISVKKNDYIYGYGKSDKKFLKTMIYLPTFVIFMLATIYFNFFLIGPILSEVFLNALNIFVKVPVIAIVKGATTSRFVIAFFSEGVFGACFSVLGFLPQICLMNIFLSVLEQSGLISRVAFLFDDVLGKIGLNGKMVYTMLMGFGCSTTATLTAKNMPDKNSQIKAALLTPFMSCSAKLPVYTVIASALFGVKSIWMILGLYLLGVLAGIVLSIVFQKTILHSDNSKFLLEFPPLKRPNIFNIFSSIKTSCFQFIIKVFGVIFCASIILWLLNNINIKFQYVEQSDKSILYSFSSIIAWMFKPIGLNNPNIICSLLVGLVAKELILSSFAISNKVENLSLLGASLVASSSAVNFNIASGVSFLIFMLLYFPCISNFGVLLKGIGVKYTVFGVGLQFILAYAISCFVYSFLTKGLNFVLIALIISLVVLISMKGIYKKIRSKQYCCDCLICNKCKNK